MVFKFKKNRSIHATYVYLCFIQLETEQTIWQFFLLTINNNTKNTPSSLSFDTFVIRL